jgi:hypothetical protein
VSSDDEGERRKLAYAYGAAYAYSHFTESDTRPIKRAYEIVELRHGSVLRTITVTIRTPSENRFGGAIDEARKIRGRFYVPLTAARRGQLLNSLKVLDESGAAVQVLHRSDSKRMIQLVLAMGWRRTFELPTEGPPERKKLAKLRRRVLSIPQLPASVAPQEASAVLQQLRSDMPEGMRADIKALERLKQLIDYFAKQTIVWVVVDGVPGQTFVLSYSYEFPYSTARLTPRNKLVDERIRLQEKGGPWSRLRRGVLWIGVVLRASREHPDSLEFLRRAMGQPPNDLVVPIGALHLAESYHFGAEVPEGNYVYKQRLIVRERNGHDTPGPAKEFRDEFADELSGEASYRGDATSGGTCAHLYTYRVKAKEDKPVYASIEFRERPPGTTGLTLTVGRVVLGLNIFLAASFLLLVQLGESAVDVVAIFLTVPAFATLWLGRSLNTDTESASRAPLLSRIANITFGLLSAFNALALMLAIAVREAAHHPGWRVYLWFWIPIMATTCLNGWLVKVLVKRRNTALREYRAAQDRLPYD